MVNRICTRMTHSRGAILKYRKHEKQTLNQGKENGVRDCFRPTCGGQSLLQQLNGTGELHLRFGRQILSTLDGELLKCVRGVGGVDVTREM